MLLYDDKADPDIVEASLAWASKTGTDLFAYNVSQDRNHGGKTQALMARLRIPCKVLMMVAYSASAAAGENVIHRFVAEYGVSTFYLCHPVKACLASEGARMDIALLTRLGAHLVEMGRRSRRLTLINDKGTSLRCTVSPQHWLAQPGGLHPAWRSAGAEGFVRGDWPNIFPLGVVGVYPDVGSAEGEVVFDHHVLCQERPLRMRFKGSFMTQCEGAAELELRRAVEDDPHAAHLAEIMLGINPRARLCFSQAPLAIEAARHTGCAIVGIGGAGLGPRYASRYHLDGVSARCSVLLDEQCVIEEGRLSELALAPFGDRERSALEATWEVC